MTSRVVSAVCQVAATIALLVSGGATLADEPNDGDLRSFIDAFQPVEIIEMMRRTPTAFGQTNDPREIPLARCSLGRVDVKLFDAAVLEHARTQFPDRDRLNEATGFLNSPPGSRMMKQIFAALPLLVARIARREDAMPPGTVELSQEEQEQISRFELTPAGKDLQRFLSKLPRVFMDRAFVTSLTEARAVCEKELNLTARPPS